MALLAGELRAVKQYTNTRTRHRLDASAELIPYFGGFFTGDGCLGLSDRRARITVKIRRDDRPLLDLFQAEFRLGHVTDIAATPPSAPTAAWVVSSAKDLPGVVSLLDRAPLRGRKLRQFNAWRNGALEIGSAAAEGRPQDADLIARARSAFATASAYRSEATLLPSGPTETDARAAYAGVLRAWAQRCRDVGLSSTAYESARNPDWPSRNTIVRLFGSWAAALAAAGLR
jgi:hypothetical protein